MAVTIHVVVGPVVMFYPEASWATNTAALRDTFGTALMTGAAMLIAGLLAAAGMIFEKRWKAWSLLFLIPQQWLLFLAAHGAVQAIYSSSFADGVVRPWSFIFADQFPYIILAIFHTLAIADHAGAFSRSFWVRK